MDKDVERSGVQHDESVGMIPVVGGLDFVEKEDSTRAKSADRMHYEAQVQVIKRQIGGLEEVRSRLGLSQRKMAQLLMVDPSAWTRWTRQEGGEQAPPHIYRALQWFMTIQDKIPGLTPHYFTGSNPEVLRQKTLEDMKKLLQEKDEVAQGLEAKIARLESQVQANRVGFFMLVLAALIMAATLFWRMKS